MALNHEKAREERLARNQISNLEMLFESELGNHTILNIVLKADTHGSLEAIIGSIKNIENEEVKINIVHESVGSVNANDVNLAMTTGAFVMGFNKGLMPPYMPLNCSILRPIN